MSKINPHSGIARFYNTLFSFPEKYDSGLAGGLDLLLREHGVKRILDCGCGTGNPSIGLVRLGYSVLGIDNSEQMLQVAEKNAKQTGIILPLRCMKMEGIHKIDEEFDCVLCHDCLYEYDDQNRLIQLFRLMRAKLRQGGCLYIATKIWDTDKDGEKRNQIENRGKVASAEGEIGVIDTYKDNILSVELTLTKPDGVATVQTFDFPWFPYSPVQITEMLKVVGFSSVMTPILQLEEAKYNCVGIIGF